MSPPHDWEVAMVLDAFRAYVELASGLTEVNRQRAVAEAKALLAQGGALETALSDQAKGLAGDVSRQVQSLADDIVATSRANRQLLTTLIRGEAERAVGSLGLATADELSALRRKIERLEQKIEDASSGSAHKRARSSATKSPPDSASGTRPAKPTVTKPSAAAKPAKKSVPPKSDASTGAPDDPASPLNPRTDP